MANAFPKIPVLIGSGTVDKRKDFGDIDPAFLFFDFLFHMEVGGRLFRPILSLLSGPLAFY